MAEEFPFANLLFRSPKIHTVSNIFSAIEKKLLLLRFDGMIKRVGGSDRMKLCFATWAANKKHREGELSFVFMKRDAVQLIRFESAEIYRCNYDAFQERDDCACGKIRDDVMGCRSRDRLCVLNAGWCQAFTYTQLSSINQEKCFVQALKPWSGLERLGNKETTLIDVTPKVSPENFNLSLEKSTETDSIFGPGSRKQIFIISQSGNIFEGTLFMHKQLPVIVELQIYFQFLSRKRRSVQS